MFELDEHHKPFKRHPKTQPNYSKMFCYDNNIFYECYACFVMALINKTSTNIHNMIPKMEKGRRRKNYSRLINKLSFRFVMLG